MEWEIYEDNNGVNVRDSSTDKTIIILPGAIDKFWELYDDKTYTIEDILIELEYV